MSATLVIASSNVHKAQEIEQMIQDAGLALRVLPMQHFGQPPEIEESAPDFRGNAALKSEGIAAWLSEQASVQAEQTWVLADDSGLCVEALDGAPGVLSARFSGPQATDASNNAKLVAELQARGLSQSPAYFCCALALTKLGGDTRFFEGRAEGEARVEPAGKGGFGYDPHVWIQGQAESFAQMSRAQKAALSHRGKALRSLFAVLPELLDG